MRVQLSSKLISTLRIERSISLVAARTSCCAPLLWIVLLLMFTSACAAQFPTSTDAHEPQVDILSGCRDDEFSSGMERIGVLRSSDRGETWEFLGDACFHAPKLLPVDPSPLTIDGAIALYFLDLRTLNLSDGESIIYQATTSDGIEFTQPKPAFRWPEKITDPYVLQMQDDTFMMYIARPVYPGGIICASSRDGLEFSPNTQVSAIRGATPGALLLPDKRVRLFVAGPEGITSLISSDGVTFTDEPGIRIPTSGIRVTDPNPIRLSDGRYLMIYVVHPIGEFDSERDRLASLEMHLAISMDGFNWSGNPTIVKNGSVPGIVEAPDGTLFIYYVDVTYK